MCSRIPFTFAPPPQQPFRSLSSPADAYRTAPTSGMSNSRRRGTSSSNTTPTSIRASVNRDRARSINRMNSTTPNGRPRPARRPYPRAVTEEDLLPTVDEHPQSDVDHTSNTNTICVFVLPHRVSVTKASCPAVILTFYAAAEKDDRAR
jgi:hypothetical protein